MNTILILGDDNIGKSVYVNTLKDIIMNNTVIYDKMIEGNFAFTEQKFHEQYYDNIAAFVIIDELKPASINVAKRIMGKYRLSYKDNYIVLLIKNYTGLESYNFFFEKYNILTKCSLLNLYDTRMSLNGLLDYCLINFNKINKSNIEPNQPHNNVCEVNDVNIESTKNNVCEVNDINIESNKNNVCEVKDINIKVNKTNETNSYINSIIKISKLKHELKEKYVEYVYSEEYQHIKYKVDDLNNIISQIIITNDDVYNNILNALICHERSIKI
jgi:hypothetical protein